MTAFATLLIGPCARQSSRKSAGSLVHSDPWSENACVRRERELAARLSLPLQHDPGGPAATPRTAADTNPAETDPAVSSMHHKRWTDEALDKTSSVPRWKVAERVDRRERMRVRREQDRRRCCHLSNTPQDLQQPQGPRHADTNPAENGPRS